MSLYQRSRGGVVLILAMGLCVMLGALALAFIARTRMDASEMAGLLRIAQSRVMLSAACAYVLEAGRIGYDLSDAYDSVRRPWATTYAWAISAGRVSADPQNTLYHEECFGWVDVRDGTVGPRTLDYDSLRDRNFDGTEDNLDPTDPEPSYYDRRYDNTKVVTRKIGGPAVRPFWPAVGGICRAPMAVMKRPPFALRPETTPNAITQDPTAWDFGLPLLRNADGNPSLSPDLPATATQAQRWADWQAGDRLPRLGGAQGAWFRLYRDAPATFIVTVGCGGTMGYRDWDEVEAEGADLRFGYDRNLFQQLLDEEERLWFRIEWSPAVATKGVLYGGSYFSDTNAVGPSDSINQAGTLSLIQRLRMQPREW